MNIFFFSWNLSEDNQIKAFDALGKMTSIYPQLDSDTLWSRKSADNKIFLATMHMPKDVVGPRQYVNCRDHVAVTYSGLPINTFDTFDAHRADHLESYWSQLSHGIEGQYVIVRCDFNAGKVELITDPFGIEPVFYIRYKNSWIVSNSVWLMLQSVPLQPTLDALGISLLLSLGRPCSEHTILSDVRMVPAASIWKWESTRTGPQQKVYYSLNDLAQLPNQRKKIDTKKLTEAMTLPMQLLTRNFGTLEIQLTGGADSRLVAALALRSRLPARYVTYGHVNAVDSYIAKKITERYRLEHQALLVNSDEVFDIWDRAWWYLLRQNDGFVGFEEIPFPDTKKLMKPARKFNIRIWGSGGGIAKGHKMHLFAHPKPNHEDVFRALSQSYLKNLKMGILHEQCIDLTENYLRQFVDNCFESGIRAIDMPDIFYLYYYLGRWPGLMARVALPICNVYSPFTTTAFVETVFSMPEEIRVKQLIHYKLIQFCKAGLHNIQYDDPMKFRHIGVNRWRNRIRRYFGCSLSKAAKSEATGLHPLNYIEAKCDHLRDLCFSCDDDLLWQLVDRKKFETITGKNTPLKERAKYLPFFNILSMVFGYAGLIKQEAEIYSYAANS